MVECTEAIFSAETRRHTQFGQKQLNMLVQLTRNKERLRSRRHLAQSSIFEGPTGSGRDGERSDLSQKIFDQDK